MPANEHTIEKLEMVLHIPNAIDAFYNFLEKEVLNPPNDDFKMLALYMDIRCFDVELQRIKNVEYLNTEESRRRDSSITKMIEKMPAPMATD